MQRRGRGGEDAAAARVPGGPGWTIRRAERGREGRGRVHAAVGCVAAVTCGSVVYGLWSDAGAV